MRSINGGVRGGSTKLQTTALNAHMFVTLYRWLLVNDEFIVFAFLLFSSFPLLFSRKDVSSPSFGYCRCWVQWSVKSAPQRFYCVLEWLVAWWVAFRGRSTTRCSCLRYLLLHWASVSVSCFHCRKCNQRFDFKLPRSFFTWIHQWVFLGFVFLGRNCQKASILIPLSNWVGRNLRFCWN